MMELSCSDVSVSGIVISFTAGLISMTTLIVIVISYFYSLITILKMQSTEGHQKTFSTCAAHLTAVILSYGTATFFYVMPKSTYSEDQNKVVSVLHSSNPRVESPHLQPLEY
jgi:olfactory receptor